MDKAKHLSPRFSLAFEVLFRYLNRLYAPKSPQSAISSNNLQIIEEEDDMLGQDQFDELFHSTSKTQITQIIDNSLGIDQEQQNPSITVYSNNQDNQNKNKREELNSMTFNNSNLNNTMSSKTLRKYLQGDMKNEGLYQNRNQQQYHTIESRKSYNQQQNDKNYMENTLMNQIQIVLDDTQKLRKSLSPDINALKSEQIDKSSIDEAPSQNFIVNKSRNSKLLAPSKTAENAQVTISNSSSSFINNQLDYTFYPKNQKLIYVNSTNQKYSRGDQARKNNNQAKKQVKASSVRRNQEYSNIIGNNQQLNYYQNMVSKSQIKNYSDINKSLIDTSQQRFEQDLDIPTTLTYQQNQNTTSTNDIILPQVKNNTSSSRNQNHDQQVSEDSKIGTMQDPLQPNDLSTIYPNINPSILKHISNSGQKKQRIATNTKRNEQTLGNDAYLSNISSQGGVGGSGGFFNISNYNSIINKQQSRNTLNASKSERQGGAGVSQNINTSQPLNTQSNSSLDNCQSPPPVIQLQNKHYHFNNSNIKIQMNNPNISIPAINNTSSSGLVGNQQVQQNLVVNNHKLQQVSNSDNQNTPQDGLTQHSQYDPQNVKKFILQKRQNPITNQLGPKQKIRIVDANTNQSLTPSLIAQKYSKTPGNDVETINLNNRSVEDYDNNNTSSPEYRSIIQAQYSANKGSSAKRLNVGQKKYFQVY
eukprot:403359553